MLRDSAVVLLVGWTAYLLATQLSGAMARGPAAHQLLLKTLLLLLSFALIAAWRKRVPGTYGFQRSSSIPWRRVALTGVVMGAAASFLILLLGGGGMQSVLGRMQFWQILLVVWIGSSVSEEIFTRGWAQGALDRWRAVRFAGYSVPVITAALLFGSMHATLFRRGVDLVTTAVVVAAATLLGLIAGQLRERYGALTPAIAVHICFNVGGAVGGAVYVVGYRLLTGRLPVTA